MATIKKLMTLLSKQGLANERANIISQFTNGRTTSAKALYEWEINSICAFFEAEQRKQNDELDKKRKRVLAAGFGAHKKMNKKVSTDYIKGFACRMAKVNDFNKIPSTRLDSIYNTFLTMQKDLSIGKRMVEGYITEQQYYN